MKRSVLNCAEKKLLETNENFGDIMFTDETIALLTPNRRQMYHKKGQVRKCKPNLKYPICVLLWAGISKRRATKGIIKSWLLPDTPTF